MPVTVLRRAVASMPFFYRGVADRLSTTSGTTRSAIISHPGLKIVSLYKLWKDWETSPGTFSSSVDQSIRDDVADAHAKNYSIIIRVSAGVDAPSWLSDPTYNIRMMHVFDTELHNESFYGYGQDPNLRIRYNLMYDHIVALLSEPCPAGGHTMWHHIVLCAASMPTENGTEASMGYGGKSPNAPGYSGTGITLASQIGKDDLGFGVTGDISSWPTGEILVRIGGTGNVNRAGFPGWRKYTDRFQRVVNPGLGQVDQWWTWKTVTAGGSIFADGSGAVFTPALGQFQYAYLDDLNPATLTKDVEVLTEFSWDVAAAGATQSGYTVLRRQSDGRQYRVRLRQDTAGVLLINISYVNAGGVITTVGVDASPPISTYSVGSKIKMRTRIKNDASSNPVFETKVWPSDPPGGMAITTNFNVEPISVAANRQQPSANIFAIHRLGYMAEQNPPANTSTPITQTFGNISGIGDFDQALSVARSSGRKVRGKLQYGNTGSPHGIPTTQSAWVSGVSYRRQEAVAANTRLYVCLVVGAGASTVAPSATSYAPTATGDGYTWQRYPEFWAVNSLGQQVDRVAVGSGDTSLLDLEQYQTIPFNASRTGLSAAASFWVNNHLDALSSWMTAARSGDTSNLPRWTDFYSWQPDFMLPGPEFSTDFKEQWKVVWTGNAFLYTVTQQATGLSATATTIDVAVLDSEWNGGIGSIWNPANMVDGKLLLLTRNGTGTNSTQMEQILVKSVSAAPSTFVANNSAGSSKTWRLLTYTVTSGTGGDPVNPTLSTNPGPPTGRGWYGTANNGTQASTHQTGPSGQTGHRIQVQQSWVGLTSTMTTGTFNFLYKGVASSTLNWNASAAQVQTALEGVSSIGTGNVIVSGTAVNTGLLISLSGSAAAGADLKRLFTQNATSGTVTLDTPLTRLSWGGVNAVYDTPQLNRSQWTRKLVASPYNMTDDSNFVTNLNAGWLAAFKAVVDLHVSKLPKSLRLSIPLGQFYGDGGTNQQSLANYLISAYGVDRFIFEFFHMTPIVSSASGTNLMSSFDLQLFDSLVSQYGAWLGGQIDSTLNKAGANEAIDKMHTNEDAKARWGRHWLITEAYNATWNDSGFPALPAYGEYVGGDTGVVTYFNNFQARLPSITSGTEPTAWAQTVTDSTATKITTGGGIGIGAQKTTGSTASVSYKWYQFEASDHVGGELLWAKKNGNAFTVNTRGAPGGRSTGHLVGETIEYLSGGILNSTWVGASPGSHPFDEPATNTEVWYQVSDEPTRRIAYRDAWQTNILDIASRINRICKVGFATGTIFGDNYSNCKTITQNLGPTMGGRLIVMTTNWSYDVIPPEGNGGNYTILTTAQAAGCHLALQVAGVAELKIQTNLNGKTDGSSRPVSDFIKAVEDALATFSTGLMFFEVGKARIDDTSVTTTPVPGAYGNWLGGTGFTYENVLLTNVNNMQDRLVKKS